jgi:hypothetical protein
MGAADLVGLLIGGELVVGEGRLQGVAAMRSIRSPSAASPVRPAFPAATILDNRAEFDALAGAATGEMLVGRWHRDGRP